eukprot:jgi/Tetstr1/459623/TSEL_000446.t1
MVDAATGSVQPDEEEPEAGTGTLRFDHGCQFFTAASPRFQAVVDRWLAAGAAGIWTGRFGALGHSSPAADFFGCSTGRPLYVGVGGMHRVARCVAKDAVAAGAELHAGVRAASIERLPAGGWRLHGVGGDAAYHDTPESVAAGAAHRLLAEVDVVLLTDASASFEGWHRASAGVAVVAPAMAAAVQSRARVPLFTAMVAFVAPLHTPLDAFAHGGDGGSSPLWYAARSASKPGLNAAGTPDCWTLVSTPAFAAAEIQGTQMQDPATGAFRPQEDGYLNGAGGPAEALLAAFLEALGRSAAPPARLYLQGQRWGSAFPAPVSRFSSTSTPGEYLATEHAGVGGSRVEVAGVVYETATPDLRPPEGGGAEGRPGEQDFFMDTELGLYYASDFCSTRVPGVEAAVLSGLDAAEHIARG